MIKVNIVTYGSDLKEQIVATVTWDGKTVKIDTKKGGIKSMLEEGFRLGGKEYTPADGEQFVDKLPYAYHGSRFRAILTK
jgi:hypothetical protein